MSVRDRDIKNKASRRRNRGNQKPATWSDVNPAVIGKFTSALADAGYAVRIGKSKDGGSYAIGIYGDGDPYTEFARPSDDLIGLLDEIALDLLGEDLMLAKID